MIELGTSKVCITPEKPLRLSGFAFRSKGYDCVRKDIFVRVMDFCSDGVRVVEICRAYAILPGGPVRAFAGAGSVRGIA